MEQLEQYGVNERVTGFVLPLGYSFNLDGSMMYQAFAALFIAQAYGIEIASPAGHHAAGDDDLEQGHRRGAARVAGGRRRRRADVQPARRRACC